MRYKFYIAFVFIFLTFIGCNDNFDPNGEFREIYALSGILRGDSLNQTITLSHVYQVDGFDPYANKVDPAVLGADVRVWIGDSVYIFRDTSVARTDSSRYTTPIHYYYNNKFAIPLNKTIEVEVLFQNGKRIKALTKSPSAIRFDKASNTIIPPDGSDLITFIWNEQNEPLYFVPQLAIKYIQNVNGTFIVKYKRVPIKYVEQNGNLVPIYPKPSGLVTAIYQKDALDRAMEEISAGDPIKSNYSIVQKQVLTVTAFDLNLTRYVSSTDQSFDDLTVTVNESEFTNVEGGLGIFGTYIRNEYNKVELSQSYVESFGYNYRVGE